MGYQFMKGSAQMLKAFVNESTERLQKIEDDIVKLESCSELGKCFDDIYCQIHIIKGLSSFFGLAEITRLGHQAELLLEVIRKDGSPTLDGQFVNYLLAAKNALSEMIIQLGEACDSAQLGKMREVIFTYDVDTLVHDIELLVEQYTELLHGEIAEEAPSEELKEANEGVSLVSNASQPDSERITLALDSVALELVDDFLLEVDEHSTIITDTLLIKLDIDPEDTKVSGDLFRRVHTLKGNLGLLLSVPLEEVMRSMLQDLLEVLQNLESLLACARDVRLPISSEIIDVCFETLDLLAGIAAMLRSGVIAANDSNLKKLAVKMLALRDDLKSTTFQKPADNKVTVIPLDNMIAPAKPVAKNVDGSGVSASHSIRVSGEKLDRLMNVIGELTMTKNVFSQIARKLNMEHNLPNLAREVKDAGQFVNRISAELEDAIMAMRMTEVRIVFQKFSRVIRDIALQTGKHINLIMEGEDTELDKNIIEQIGDPLLHLVRNSCDHGIETVEERQAAGKDPEGHVWLRAYNRGKHIIIEIEDDGRGMSPEFLKGKAVEKGFLTEQESEAMSDEQALQLIFLPGFSTAKNVTEISGRGVGMDVVHSNVTALQGTLKITSQLGKGSKITVQLPLTLMVSRGLVVEVQGQLLVMPIDNVLEMVKVTADKLVKRRGKHILYHRGEVLGVVSLAEALSMPSQELAEYTPIVVVTDGQAKVAMIVDKLLNEQDILVKPLPDYLSTIRGLGGATIMGDGKVALVLNPAELIQLAIR